MVKISYSWKKNSRFRGPMFILFADDFLLLVTFWGGHGPIFCDEKALYCDIVVV